MTGLRISFGEGPQTTGGVPQAPPLRGEPLGLYHGRPLASWGSRVVAYIIDWLFGLLLFVPGGVLVGIGAVAHGATQVILVTVGAVLLLVAAVVQIWQTAWRQGARGQSWGKVVTGLRTVDLQTMQPIGGPRGLLRWLIDALLGSVGVLWLLNYLWPLWDERNQTWSDKLVGSVVLSG